MSSQAKKSKTYFPHLGHIGTKMIYLFTVIYIKSMNITPHNKKLNLISYLETFILVIDSGRKIYQNILPGPVK